MASPILLLLYPLAITLIVMIFTNNLFHGRRSVYIGTMIGVGFVAVLDALKDANVAPETMNQLFGFIPLFQNGAGWIVTGIIGFLVGLIVAKRKNEPSVIIDLEQKEAN